MFILFIKKEIYLEKITIH